MTAPSLVPGQEGFVFFDGVQGPASCGLPNPVGTGNCLVAYVKLAATSVIGSVKDSLGNDLTQVDSTLGGGSNQSLMVTYVRQNCTGGPNGVTVTGIGNISFPRVIVREYTGCATDGTAVNAHEFHNQSTSSTSADTVTSAGSATTSVSDTRLVAFTVNHDSNSAVVAGTGFGNFSTFSTAPNNADILFAEDKSQTAPGAAHGTFTKSASTSNNWTTMMIALAPPDPGSAMITASPKVVTAIGKVASLIYSATPPSAEFTVTKVAPHFPTDTIGTVSYRVLRESAGSLSEVIARTTTGVVAISGASPYGHAAVFDVDLDDDGEFHGLIVWWRDTGDTEPVADEIVLTAGGTAHVAPYYVTDIVTDPEFRVMQGSGGALVADVARTGTGVISISGVVNGYCADPSVSVNSDGSYSGIITWWRDSGDATPITDDINIAPTGSGGGGDGGGGDGGGDPGDGGSTGGGGPGDTTGVRMRLAYSNIFEDAEVSVTSEATGFPASNAKTPDRDELWRSTDLSTQVWEWTWGGEDRGIDHVSIWNHRLHGASARWELFSDASLSTPATPYFDSGTIAVATNIALGSLRWGHVDSATPEFTDLYYRLQAFKLWFARTIVKGVRLTLTGTPIDGLDFFEAGMIFGGPSFLPERAPTFGLGLALPSSTEYRRSGGGSNRVAAGSQYPRVELTMGAISDENERAAWFDHMRMLGTGRSCVLSLYQGLGGRLERDLTLCGRFVDVDPLIFATRNTRTKRFTFEGN